MPTTIPIPTTVEELVEALNTAIRSEETHYAHFDYTQEPRDFDSWFHLTLKGTQGDPCTVRLDLDFIQGTVESRVVTSFTMGFQFVIRRLDKVVVARVGLERDPREFAGQIRISLSIQVPFHPAGYLYKIEPKDTTVEMMMVEVTWGKDLRVRCRVTRDETHTVACAVCGRPMQFISEVAIEEVSEGGRLIPLTTFGDRRSNFNRLTLVNARQLPCPNCR